MAAPSTKERVAALWFAASMRGAHAEDEMISWVVSHGYGAEDQEGGFVLTKEGRTYADELIAQQRNTVRPPLQPRGEGVAKIGAALLGLGLLVVLRRRRRRG